MRKILVIGMAILAGCAGNKANEIYSSNSMRMDFSIELTAIANDNKPFSEYSSKPLLIYYYSPHCPHCPKTYANVKSMAKSYKLYGLDFIAISAGATDKKDVLAFIEQHESFAKTTPFFQDSKRVFGEKYSEGYVPRIYLVYPDGSFILYRNAYSEGLNEIRADLNRLFELNSNDKCKEFMELPVEGKEILPTPSDTLFNSDIQENCICNETINCKNVDYCYSFLCPDGSIIPWIR